MEAFELLTTGKLKLKETTSVDVSQGGGAKEGGGEAGGGASMGCHRPRHVQNTDQ